MSRCKQNSQKIKNQNKLFYVTTWIWQCCQNSWFITKSVIFDLASVTKNSCSWQITNPLKVRDFRKFPKKSGRSPIFDQKVSIFVKKYLKFSLKKPNQNFFKKILFFKEKIFLWIFFKKNITNFLNFEKI